MVKIRLTQSCTIDHTRYGTVAYKDDKFCCTVHNTKQIKDVLARYKLVTPNMINILRDLTDLINIENTTKQSLEI